jgi:membrane fusion protein, copper/silver efflux system
VRSIRLGRWGVIAAVVLLGMRGVRAEEEHAHGAEAGAAPPVREEPRVPIAVPLDQQAKIGLKTQAARRERLEHRIRTVASVAIDERRQAHVHTRFAGWIEGIRVDFVGRPVAKGETLCSFYSPELVALQDEYLAARGRSGLGAEVAAAAVERLRLFGVPEREIARLERGEKRKLLIPIDSPISGYVVAKSAIQGMYVTPEMELYQIADLSRVWLLAELYEYDLPIVAVGDEALVTLTYEPERRLRGRITYIYPEVTGQTRTGRARLEVDNLEGRLKPGQYANVEIEKDLGEVVVVPDSAVIDTGVRKIVFVRTQEERFEPREVKVGARSDARLAVLSGLAEGEQIVTSANFLIDAESRLRAAVEKKGGAASPHSGHGTK